MATKSIGELTQDEFLRILGPEHGSKSDGSFVTLGQEGDPHICVQTENGKLHVFGPDEFRRTVTGAFERQSKINEIQKSIYYQNKKISALFNLRRKYVDGYLRLHFSDTKFDDSEEHQNICQILHDGLLNAISSIIDYYNIFFMIKLGIPFNRLNDVQHKKINNYEIKKIHKDIKATRNNELFFLSLHEKILKNEHLKHILDSDDPWDYILFIHGDIILNHLKDFEIVDKEQKLYVTEGDKLVFCEKVMAYFNYVRDLLCTRSIPYGAQYNIYLELNNFLKHNTVPFVIPHLEIFEENERRGYAYFEINNSQYCYLKDGIIKHFANIDFERLKHCLNEKITNDKSTLIEDEIGLPGIIKIDKKHGITNGDDKIVYFQIGRVMLARKKDSILIDSMSSLESTYVEIWNDIQRCLRPQVSEGIM